MIWLITLFLLVVASYLALQALSERKLVESEIESGETLDDDPGLFMRMNERLNSDPKQGDIAIADDDSKFGKMVQRVQNKSANTEERIERKIAAATADDQADSFFERSISKVQTATESTEQKLSAKFASNDAVVSDQSIKDDDSIVGRMVTKVGDGLKKSETKFQAKIDRSTESEVTSLSDEGGFFASAIAKVSSGLESIDTKVEEKLASVRSDDTDSELRELSSNEDFFSRVSGKIGDRVNQADDKIVEASRKLNRR